jgi:hypothetical protein
LLDALVQEGVIKESKAESIRAKLTADYKKTSAGKIQIDSSVKELKFYGDARYRFQWDETGPQTKGYSHVLQQRERLRLRLGADAKLADDFVVGFQLSTGKNADSDNSTIADTNEGGAGFSKLPIYISKAYLGWEPRKGLNLVLGKQANPFYFNDQGLVWDADINPAGVSEKAELHKLLGWVGPWEVTVTAGQFVFQDNKETVIGTTAPNVGKKTGVQNDTVLLEGQVAVAYKYDDNNKVTVAPGFLAYNNESTSGAANSAAYTTGTNGSQGFQLLLLPGDYSTKIAGIKTKFLWDFSYNVDGETRSKVYGLKQEGTAGATPANQRSSKDDYAWLVGAALGETKKKGDVSFLANYRQVGITSVDPNLNDSDFGSSYLNIRGFKVGAGYSLSNAVVLNVAYQNAFNLGHQLSTPATLNVNNVQIIQADVTVKF